MLHSSGFTFKLEKDICFPTEQNKSRKPTQQMWKQDPDIFWTNRGDQFMLRRHQFATSQVKFVDWLVWHVSDRLKNAEYKQAQMGRIATHQAVTIVQLNCTRAQNVHRFSLKLEMQNDAGFRE